MCMFSSVKYRHVVVRYSFCCTALFSHKQKGEKRSLYELALLILIKNMKKCPSDIS